MNKIKSLNIPYSIVVQYLSKCATEFGGSYGTKDRAAGTAFPRLELPVYLWFSTCVLGAVASVEQKLRYSNMTGVLAHQESSPVAIPSVDSIILPQQLPVSLQCTAAAANFTII